jgi:predicted regulator of Ras-like GTPase activity (Roadblock/LC7/MglB family)
LGAVLGLLISLMHGLPLTTAVTIGMWSYPPAFVLHVCFAPFLLRPLYGRIWERGIRFSLNSGRPAAQPRQSSGFSFSNMPGTAAQAKPRTESGEVSFDAATTWIGEYSGVRIATLVDEDGLVISRWERQKYSQDAEYWAAIAVEMTRFHRQWPAAEAVDLRRLEIETSSGRLTIKRAGQFWLVVLTEMDAGELVSVRIAQAIDMIEKHRNDRYRAVRPAGLEVSYV